MSDNVGRFLKTSRERLALSGFRKFILRGNVVDLAIGVVIGAAFTAIVTALVGDFLTPLIGIALKNGGGQSFADHYWNVNGSLFKYGDFVNHIITFLLIALAVYYFIVLPVNSLMERYKPEPDMGEPTKTCPECRSSIPWEATRCAFCTVVQPPVEAPPAAP